MRWLWIILPFVTPFIGFAQEWVARYNGPGNGTDNACAIAIDYVANIFVTGSSLGSGPGSDYATVKYDSAGVEQWVARYNGPANEWDVAQAIAVDNSGNVIVTGNSLGSGTGFDYATVKYNSAGVEQWVARYNGLGNDLDAALAIAVDASDNIYVTGTSFTGSDCDYATIKYDSFGTQQWVVRYNGSANYHDEPRAMVIDNLSNVIVTGTSDGQSTSQDYATVKYDSAGVEQWVARYNGPGNGEDEPHDITLDNAGNVYVTGNTYISNLNYYDYATVKYNSAGVEQWTVCYNGPANEMDVAQAIAVNNTDGIFVTGGSRGQGTNWDYATIMYDSTGAEQWVERFVGTGNGADNACAIAIDNTNHIYVTGYSFGSGTDDDYATVKYESSGAVCYVAMYNGPGNNDDKACAIVIDNSDNIYVTGSSVGSGTAHDYATIKYPFDYGITEEPVNELHNRKRLGTTIFNSALQLPSGIPAKVFDITGRQIHTLNPVPGIYFIEIEGKITQKVIKVR